MPPFFSHLDGPDSSFVDLTSSPSVPQHLQRQQHQQQHQQQHLQPTSHKRSADEGAAAGEGSNKRQRQDLSLFVNDDDEDEAPNTEEELQKTQLQQAVSNQQHEDGDKSNSGKPLG